MSDPRMKIIKEAAFSARSKVVWAQVHIGQLERVAKVLTGHDGYVMESECDADTGYYTLYIGPKDRGWPIELFMHTGDAIHNLNCVMDHLWSGLARAVKPDIESKITFPRDETRESLVTRLGDAKGYHAALKQAFPRAEDFILDVVQPYRGDHGPIWALNKLDNINKHRRFLASYHVTRFGKVFRAKMKGGGGMDLSGATFNNATGAPMRMTFGEAFDVEYDVKPTVDICFAEPDLFPGAPIIETMVNLAEATTKVIDAFEESFLIGHGVAPTPEGVPG